MNLHAAPQLWQTTLPSGLPPRALVGRQGIFTRDGDPRGHELLYRAEHPAPTSVDRWSAEDQDRATEHVIAATFFRHPDITAPLPAFVNFTGTYLLSRAVERECDPGRVVIEIVESVEVDAALLERIASLKAQGFAIAIDDFVGSSCQMRLLPLADYVKIDWRDLLRVGAGLVDAARAYGALLVAERVEDDAILAECIRLGFDLYQGWHFERAVTFDRGDRDLAPALV
ncbi:EAL domain-containing protein [Demequina mangrovi]|uniref:EAL domain-containing protein n=1 Tax=Demequina mangrovi TaxID=1043493 RepID=UPI000694D7B7|nr:EAL domain-containing protein [Demequina mangrovi]